MEKSNNLVKLFLMRAKRNLIIEVDKNDLRNSFFELKKMKQFQPLLSSYEWNKNGLCIKLELEINDLIFNHQVSQYGNYLYINNMKEDYENMLDIDTIKLIDQMISNFIQFNMSKQKVKTIK